MTADKRVEIAMLLGGDPSSLSGDLDEIEAVVRLYRENKAVAATLPDRKTRRKHLADFQKSLSIIAVPTNTVEVAFGGSREFESMVHAARQIMPLVTESLNTDASNPLRGPSPDDRQWAISRLGAIYSRLTCRPPTANWNDYQSGYSGPFFEFMRILFTQDEFSDAALGTEIKRARQAAES